MMATELDRIRLGGRNYLRVGDLTKVAPSRPGRRDGYIGRVVRIVDGPEGVIVDVAGGPRGKAKAVRPLRIERLARTQAQEATR